MLMELDIFSSGQEYISASRASEKVGYAQDYIGQLCRAKKVPGKLVGRTWYVDLSALLHHKKNSQLGKRKKTFLSSNRAYPSPLIIGNGSRGEENYLDPSHLILPRSFKDVEITYLNDDGPRLPEIKPKNLNLNANHFILVRQVAVLSFSLLLTLGLGLSTLKITNPKLAHELSQVASATFSRASVLDSISDSLGKFSESWSDLRAIVFGSSPPLEPEYASVVVETPRGERTPNTFTTVVRSSQSSNTSLQEMKSELESYVRALVSGISLREIASLVTPQTINASILRQEILYSDTRPSITRQSDSDAGRTSSVISALTDGGTFTNAKITNSRGEFSSLGFTSLSGASASSTSLYVSGLASTTELRANTASIGNLTLGFSTLTNLLVNGSSTLQTFTASSSTIPTFLASNATSTNLHISGLASTTLLRANSSIFGDILTGFGTFTNILANGSTTLQNFTFTNATGTSATTTDFYVSGLASTTNFRTNIGTIGSLTSGFSTLTNLLVNGSSTLQTFTASSSTIPTFLASNATSTNLHISNLASTTNLRANSSIFGDILTGFGTFTNILANGSTTLQNFTFTSATGTSATTTDLYVSNLASTTNFRANIGTIGSLTSGFSTLTNLLVNGSSTLQNLTFQSATGTSATTTDLYVSNLASTTNLRANSSIFGDITTGLGTFTNLLANGSSTLQTVGMTYASTTQIGSTGNAYFATSGGNVGIGTTAPSDLLTVSHSTSATLGLRLVGLPDVFTVTHDNSYSKIGTTNNNLIVQTDSGVNLIELDKNTNFIRFTTNSAEKMRIDTGGKLGLGTTTPFAKFSIAGSTAGTTLLATDAISGFSGRLLDLMVASTTKFSINQTGDIFSNGSTTLQNFTFQNATGTLLSLFGTNTDGAARFSASSTAGVTMDWIVGVDLSDSGKFKIASSTALGTNDRFVIDGSGNVGIGTTAPRGKLDVLISGTANTDGDTITTPIITGPTVTLGSANGGHLTLQSNTDLAIDGGGVLGFGARHETAATGAATFAQIKGAKENATTGNLAGYFAVATRPAGGNNPLERMRIDSTGNVGIGTTGPAKKLQVSVTASGDGIGIDGTTNPAYNLRVSGTTQGNWAVATAADVWFTGSVLNDTALVASNGNLGLVTGSTARLYINTSGNVGIGTTGPGAKLDVRGDSQIVTTGTTAGLSIVASSTGATAIDNGGILSLMGTYRTSSADYSGNTTSFGQVKGLKENGTSGNYAGYLSLFTVPNAGSLTERVRIDSTGNVGIGMTNPGQKLSVEGRLRAVLTTGTDNGVVCIDTADELLRRAATSCAVSSIRFKENVQDLNYGLADIGKLRPVSFDYKAEMQYPGTKIGFIAEEVEGVIPEVITYEKGVVFGVDYPLLTSLLTKGIQELKSLFDALEAKIELILVWFKDGKFQVQGDICVDDVCVTKEQFKQMLLNSGAQPSQNASAGAVGATQYNTGETQNTPQQSSGQAETQSTDSAQEPEAQTEETATTTEPTLDLTSDSAEATPDKPGEVVEPAPTAQLPVSEPLAEPAPEVVSEPASTE